MEIDYDFTLPNGKKLTWREIEVGTTMDLRASHRTEAARENLPITLAVARITSFDGVPVADCKPPMSVQVRSWKERDFEAYFEEIQRVEGDLALAFKKDKVRRMPSDAVATAKMGVLTALGELGNALKILFDVAEALDAASPLDQGKT